MVSIDDHARRAAPREHGPNWGLSRVSPHQGSPVQRPLRRPAPLFRTGCPAHHYPATHGPRWAQDEQDPRQRHPASSVRGPDRGLIRRASTDSDRHITYDPAGRPAVANLLELLAAAIDNDPACLADEIGPQGAGHLKRMLTEAINELLRPLRNRRRHRQQSCLRQPGHHYRKPTSTTDRRTHPRPSPQRSRHALRQPLKHLST